MTTFTARVELLNANTKDYDVLQTEMKKENFVVAKKAAEFKSRNKASISEVNDAVLRAASKTGKKFTFTVMKDKFLDKLQSA